MSNSYYILFIFFSIFFFSSTWNCFSQEKDFKTIQDEHNYLRHRGDFEKTIVFLLDFLDSDQAKSDIDLIFWGQISLANVLWASGRFDECYNYLQKAEKTLEKVNDNLLIAKFHQEYSQYYYQLGFINLAIHRNELAKSSCMKLDDTEPRRNLLSYIYGTRKIMHLDLNQEDSAIYYVYKSIESSEDSNNFTFLLKHYIQKNEKDSVDKYLNIVKSLATSEKVSPTRMIWLYNALGHFYLLHEDFDTAFEYIKKEVQLAEDIGRYVFLASAYSSMAQYFNLVNEELEYLRFKAKATEFKDLLNTKKEESASLTVDTLLRLNDDKINNISRRNSILLICFLVSFLILVFYFYWLNEKKKQEIFVVEEDVRMMQMERKELKKKVDTTYDEVILLAKANDPAFLARFQEVFKPIFNKFESLTPALTTEELKLCAMIYFNFSTKDIASFTFVQTKTIQMKKYRLRKKLNIDSSIDLSEWVRNL